MMGQEDSKFIRPIPSFVYIFFLSFSLPSSFSTFSRACFCLPRAGNKGVPTTNQLVCEYSDNLLQKEVNGAGEMA